MRSVPLEAGQRLGRFTIIRLAAVGGTGGVYEARDDHDRKVALKLLSRSLVEEEESLHRFREEAQLWGRLRHPGIAALIEVGEHEGIPYIVSEWVEGRTLAEHLSRGSNEDSGVGPSKGEAALEQRLVWIREIAEALSAAHGLGILHRDLKPSNIMIDEQGRARLIDFGLAKPLLPQPRSERSFETLEGRVVGTPAYMSPEQARGEPLCLASDVFSFGALAYELLSGRPAFERGSLAETLQSVLSETPPAFGRRFRSRDRALNALVFSCLDKNPAHRPPDARHLVVKLRELSKTPSRRLRGPALAFSLLAIVMLFTLVGAGIVLSRGPDHEIVSRAALGLRSLRIQGDLPVITHDGRGVLFRSEDMREIWFAPVGAGNPQLVHAGAGPVTDLHLSADDRQVYFVARDREGKQWISVVPVHGGAARRIVEGVAVSSTPDGSRLVYICDPEPGVMLLKTCAPDGAMQRTVRRLRESSTLRGLIVNRAGSAAILALSDGLHRSDLVEIDLAGGSPRLLGELDGPARPGIALTPDGKGVLWSVSLDGMLGNVIGLTPLDGGGFEPVYPGSESLSSISISSDGRRMVFAARERHFEIVEARIDPNHIVPSSSFRVLPGVTGTQPRVSPRGDRIAFQSERSDIWLFDRATGDRTPLLSTGESTFNPAWSPDGRLIAYACLRHGQSDLWLAGAMGDAPQQITDDPANDFQPVWCPDRKHLIFISDRDGFEDLYLIDIATGAIRRMGHDGAINPALSPDGSLLSYVVPGTGTQIELRLQRLEKDLSPGKILWTHLLERNRWAGGKPRFSPDGRFVAFDQAMGSSGADIYAYPTHPPFPDAPRRLTHFSRPVSIVSWFDWAPEGKLVISAAREETRIVLIEGADLFLHPPCSPGRGGDVNALFSTHRRDGRGSLR